MKLHRKSIASALVAAFIGLGYAGGASASLVLLGASSDPGQGYGNVINLLSMHKSGGAGTAADVESGKVAWNGTSDVITGTYALTDPNKTATHTFSSVGLSGATAAANLRLIWDPSEVGSATGDDTQVDQLILSIYAPTGGALFSYSLAAPVLHTYLVGAGLGVGDFVYGLDGTQAAALQSQLTGIGDFSAYRIGLESTVSLVDDGPDTWLLGNAGATGPCVPSPSNNNCGNQVPEPGILSLAAIGMLGVAVATRRRRRG